MTFAEDGGGVAYLSGAVQLTDNALAQTPPGAVAAGCSGARSPTFRRGITLNRADLLAQAGYTSASARR
ncbi:MAG: hypothetical protein U1E76_13800 [Planctomycetota bacterium]